MSEQERPSGRPPIPQDFSLPSLGEQLDSDDRPIANSRPRKSMSRPFDPTQYVQGRPAGNAPEESRSNRRGVPEDVEREDLPPPSYQPKNTPQTVHSVPEPVGGTPSVDTSERIFPREDTGIESTTHTPLFVPTGHETPQQNAEPEKAPNRSMAKTLNVFGAMISIALVLGLGFWGYRLAVRDVSGIPIVAALDGPMRIQPEDPGGELATHQGLAVNAVQAAGEAEATAERLVLAPQPVEVRDGDGVLTTPIIAMPKTVKSPEIEAEGPNKLEAHVTNTEQVPASADAAASGSSKEIEDPFLKSTPAIEKTVEAAVVIKAPAALDVAAATERAVLEIEQNEAQTPDVSAEEPKLEILSASVPGVSKSLRPLSRPADFADRVESQRAAIATPNEAGEPTDDQSVANTIGANEIAPETLVVGTNLAQLGAYPSAQIARAEWDKKAARFEDYMEGKMRVIQQAESGGRAFFRLRAHGFETINESRQFCAALQAEGAECISVVVRK